MLLQECSRARLSRAQCIEISKNDNRTPGLHASRYFTWLRQCYQTKGKNWSIIGVRPIVEAGVSHGAMYDVLVGDVHMTVQYVLERFRYDGLVAAVAQVGGVDTKVLEQESMAHCPDQKREIR
jgi:hypothetical protein